MPTLLVVIASTRPGRIGLPVGQWFEGHAREHGGFDVEVADLAEIDLPFLDEPHHPRMREYTHEHTKAWSATVDAADAFAFVMPEYNYGLNAPLKNAIDYLHHEWAHKPVGFVSYGGVSGGTRAVQMAKQVVTALRVVPVSNAVAIPWVFQHVQDGVFTPPEGLDGSATAMLDELAALSGALATLRQPT